MCATLEEEICQFPPSCPAISGELASFSHGGGLRKEKAGSVALWKGDGMRTGSELAAVANMPVSLSSPLLRLHILYLENEGLDVIIFQILSGSPKLDE